MFAEETGSIRGGPRDGLKTLLDIDSLGNNEYRPKNLRMAKGARAVYGGQVFGLALMAATKCVMDQDPSFLLQSFHCYFVGPMQCSPDVMYRVNRAKYGKSFYSVSVEAVQSGKVCFHCLVSFQKSQEIKTGLDYSSSVMPNVPKPKDSLFLHEILENDTIDPKKLLVIKHHQWSGYMWPMEVYVCTNVETIRKRLAKEPSPPRHSLWIKGLKGIYGESDHQNYHRIVLAYTSDLMAWMITYMYPEVQIGLIPSLDHSMWFYSPVNSENWHFYDNEVEHCNNGRALNTSRIYSEDGQVVAICKQESLVRPKL